MKPILFLIPFLVLFSCKKNDISTPDNSPLLSLDSLKTLSSNIPNAAYTDLTFINETIGFAIAQGVVVKTADGGNTWTSVTVPINTPLKKIQFTDSQTGYIIGGDNTMGVLLKTRDGGQTWAVINLNTLESPTGLYFIDRNTGFIVGKNLFSKTIDGGQTWTSQKFNGVRRFQDGKFKNNNEGYVTSSGGVYFKTLNGGNSWDSLIYRGANYLYDIYFTGDKTFVVQSTDSLVDLAHGYAVTKKPANAFKFAFFTPERSIAIGAHYTQGFFPYGDIMITNDGWNTFTQNTFSTVVSIGFSAIAKMSDRKVMILGVGFSGPTVMVLNW